MSQRDHVLELLRAAGSKGVHTFELRRAFVGNPSERIRELRSLGHVIATSHKEQLHGDAVGVRYTLELDAERDIPPAKGGNGVDVSLNAKPNPPVEPQTPLFEVPPAQGSYRDDDWAA